jgi:hypothetical protein
VPSLTPARHHGVLSGPPSGRPLRYSIPPDCEADSLRTAPHQLAVEIVSRDDLVSFGGLGQREWMVDRATPASVMHHRHHRGEAAMTAGTTSHQRQSASTAIPAKWKRAERRARCLYARMTGERDRCLSPYVRRRVCRCHVEEVPESAALTATAPAF